MAIKRTYGPSMALYGQIAGEGAKRTEEERRKQALFEMLLNAQLKREGLSLEEELQKERLKQQESEFGRELGLKGKSLAQDEILNAMRAGYLPRGAYQGISPEAKSGIASHRRAMQNVAWGSSYKPLQY